ncbi:rhodanese-like domain-containing protein [Methanogenium cariaci]|uniref:rhodanese-like domain-containing protein n=1 Tax=Methanogenium cariaci TaxID=2197 RepID=UPI001FDECD00|nr:rhodanese-like domain-containing protein [Methanogenium cariaci]
MKPAEFYERMMNADTIVVSIRNYATFGGQHIPGSYHIDMGGNFSTFAGWVLPPDREILLVTDSPEQAREAAVQLRRVGLDRTIGYLKGGGTHAWVSAGYTTDHIHQLSPPRKCMKKFRTPTRFFSMSDLLTNTKSGTYRGGSQHPGHGSQDTGR